MLPPQLHPRAVHCTRAAAVAAAPERRTSSRMFVLHFISFGFPSLWQPSPSTVVPSITPAGCTPPPHAHRIATACVIAGGTWQQQRHAVMSSGADARLRLMACAGLMLHAVEEKGSHGSAQSLY